MKQRRSLVEGVKTAERSDEEKEFVYGKKEPQPQPIDVGETNRPSAPPPDEIPKQQADILPQMAGRQPITIRCTPQIASALKRVSLQRQLSGVKPYHMQDIAEQALRTWLESNT